MYAYVLQVYLSSAFRTKILYINCFVASKCLMPPHIVVDDLITRMVGLCDVRYSS
jgi:hypothetical protein